MKKILISKPNIDHRDLTLVNKAAIDGWGNNYLFYNNKFEKDFSSYIGGKYCIATSSCTGATHIALKALNIKKNDEIILPNITWFSCASVINYMGAKPIFVDIDPKTFCIDPSKIEEKITKKTKAILIVHLYGAVCNIEKIKKVSNKKNIPLIEDCAESLGSKYKSKKTGIYGKISVFSFHGSKTITTGGEGGAIITNDKSLYLKMLKISNHGKNRKKIFFQDDVGLKYKMSSLQSAMGISQLKKIDKINLYKNKIYNFFKRKLKNLPINFQISDTKSTAYYWMPTFYVENENFNRDHFLKYMNQNGINLRPVFYPLHNFRFYKFKSYKDEFSVSEKISKYGVNLPSYFDLEKKEMESIIKHIQKYFFLNKLI